MNVKQRDRKKKETEYFKLSVCLHVVSLRSHVGPLNSAKDANKYVNNKV